MSNPIDQAWQSYQRCIGEFDFLHDFYLSFIESAPEIAAHFERTDIDHQTVMLRASLDLMLGNPQQQERHDLNAIAKAHSRAGFGIPPQLYDFWLDSLLSTVRNYDHAFNTELEQAWRDALRPGIDYMKEAY
ncbi:MAG: globin [Motiliproteus sp.]